ncbi:MAG: 2-isopropylmalate synthase [Candidatus Hydrogenedens sp.]|nr:2-isopropylmalate synthase [Candidatus Hydrogenedentota bacterium]NLF59201.1 2-isopropylmalate synthase [Candidatus Hydrogenedens sp.]
MERQIRFFDTTLRDGEQTPGVHFDADVKTVLARRLEEFGAATIEAGFPASSPGDAEAVRRVAGAITRAEVAALARCRAGDIDAAAEALSPAVTPVIHLVLGVSDIHLERKLKMTRARAVRAIAESVAHARRRAERVQFSAEDATRADPIFLRQCVMAAVGEGASRVNLPDTVGCAVPEEYGAMIADMAAFAGPDIIVSAHCHNDLGLATANTVAAVRAGARQVEVSVNGLGERAGNAAAEEVAAVLRLKGVAGTGIRLEHATELSRMVAELSGVPVQPNRALVGGNAFVHSSGIHQDGILKAPENYEFVPPALVGASGHCFVITARSGRSAVAHEAARAGHSLSEDETDRVYREVVRHAEARRGRVTREEVARIAVECVRQNALS